MNLPALPDLSVLRRVLAERFVLLLVIILAFGAIGLAFQLRSTRSFYETYSVVDLRALAPDSVLLGLRPLTLTVSPDLASADALALLRSSRVVARVGRRLSRSRVLDAANTRMGAVPHGTQGAVRIVLQGQRPDELAAIANAVAAELVRQYRRRTIRRLDQIIGSLGRRQQLIGEEPNSFLHALLGRLAARELARLRVVRRTANPARLVERAPVPDERRSVSAGQLLPALLLGLSTALLTAFGVDAFTRRPRDARRLGTAAGLAVAVELPLGSGGTEPHDGFRRLLRLVSHRVGGRAGVVVAVLGVGSRAGTADVALGLAETARARGESVSLLRLSRDGEAPEGEGSPSENAARVEDLSEAARTQDRMLVALPPWAGATSGAVVVADVVVLCARAGQATLDDLERAGAAFRDDPRAVLVVLGTTRPGFANADDRHRLRRFRLWPAA